MKRNWEYKKLGDVATFINGYPFKPSEWKSEGCPIIRIQNLNNPLVAYNYYDKPLDERYIVKSGDVLISWSGTLGVYEWSGEKAFLNQHIFKVLFNKGEINKSFFKYVVSSRIQEMKSKVHGITMQHITKGDFDKTKVPVPPLDEQSRIVAELDLLTGIIDKQDAQLKELDNLAQAIFYDMFGDPIENPKGWEVKKLGDVCSVVNGLVNPNEEPFCNYPHIGGANIQSNTGVFVDVKLAKDEGLISGKYLFDESMILYSKIRPNLNKVALPSFKGICSADMYPLITNTDVANKYYIKFSITHKKFIEYAVSHSGRANIPKINRDALLAYDLPLPPLALQQSFAEKIQSIEKQKETFRASIADTQKLLDYTMDKYFG